MAVVRHSLAYLKVMSRGMTVTQCAAKSEMFVARICVGKLGGFTGFLAEARSFGSRDVPFAVWMGLDAILVGNVSCLDAASLRRVRALAEPVAPRRCQRAASSCGITWEGCVWF